MSTSDHSLAEALLREATKRAEHQRKIVAQLMHHDYPAEQAQSLLDNCEETLFVMRDEETARSRS